MCTRLARLSLSCAVVLLAACGEDPSPVTTDAAAAPDAPPVAETAVPSFEVPSAVGLVRALTITDVSLFQAVRVPLLADGVEVTAPTVPVIAERAAVVRVYVRPEAGFQPGGIDAELTVRRGELGTILRDRRSISRVSRDEAEGTVFQFALPAETVGADTRISVRLLAPGGVDVAPGVDDGARFPAAGAEHAVRAQYDGGIDVVLVPLRWDVDGSGRLPSTDADQLEAMRALVRAMYPVNEVRLSVHAPVAWTRGLLPSGNADFGAMITTLRALRLSERAPSGFYYYGLVRPTEYVDEYCQGPCTLGQGYLGVVANDRSGKVAAGLGYYGDRAAETFAHELGHNHGRAHAPCGGAAGPDLAYPFPAGNIGGWGLDERRRVLIRPGAFDFMGYCEPRWVSEYGYARLWERITAVNGMPVTIGLGSATRGAEMTRRHRVLRLDGGAMTEWLDGLELPAVTAGEASLRWRDPAGRSVGATVAQADRLGDSNEVHVLVPPPPSGASIVEVTLDGRTRSTALPARW